MRFMPKHALLVAGIVALCAQPAAQGRQPRPFNDEIVTLKRVHDVLLGRSGDAAMQLLREVAEQGESSTTPTLEEWNSMGMSPRNLSRLFSPIPVRESAIEMLELRYPAQNGAFFSALAHREDLDHSLRHLANLSSWRIRAAAVRDWDARRTLLESALEARLDGEFADNVRDWAANELCNAGEEQSLAAIRRAITNRDPFEPGIQAADFCARRVEALAMHPDRIEALAAVLWRAESEAGYDLKSWAVSQLGLLRSPAADQRLIDYATTLPETGASPQEQELSRLRNEIRQSLSERGWTADELEKRGIGRPGQRRN